jgi:Tfp pilus assembly protein PilF
MSEKVRIDIDALAEADEGDNFASFAQVLHKISVEERDRRRHRALKASLILAVALSVACGGVMYANRSLARSVAQRADAAYERAVDYNHNRRHSEALEAINTALGLRPNSAEFYNERGEAYLGLGEKWHEHARKSFEKARELDPGNVRAHTKLGWYNASEGNYVESRKQFDKALNIAKHEEHKRALVLCDRGWALLREYDEKQAKKQRSSEIQPLLAEALNYLKESRDILTRLNETDPKLADVYNNLAWAANLSHDPHGAIENSKKAIELVPTFGWAFNSLADAFVTTGQYEAALNFYSKGIAVDPANGQMYCNRSKLHLKMKNKALAEKDQKAAQTLGFHCDE